jgi:hypothetical protein
MLGAPGSIPLRSELEKKLITLWCTLTFVTYYTQSKKFLPPGRNI